LSEAPKLRESLADAGSAAATRQNLSFLLAPEIGPAPKPPPAGHWAEFDSLPLRRGSEVAFRIQRPRGGGTLAIAALLLVLLGGITYWAADQPDLRSLDVTALTSLLAPPEASSRPVASPARSGRAWSEASVQATPDVKAPAPPSILIFTPRPGSLGPAKLCYAVAGAVRAVVEPGVGDVTPTSHLTCVRVAPARTTTYQLTALGPDGEQVRQRLVVLVR
jgi:hypothetical protein